MEMMEPAGGAAKEDWVAIEEVEFERVGEVERKDGAAGGGEAAASGSRGLDELRWCWTCCTGKGDCGFAVVGVARGVFWDDDWDVRDLTTGISPLYTWPSSPAEKVRVEQKPSEDVMSNVKPSFDLSLLVGKEASKDSYTYQVKSVKVAQ